MDSIAIVLEQQNKSLAMLERNQSQIIDRLKKDESRDAIVLLQVRQYRESQQSRHRYQSRERQQKCKRSRGYQHPLSHHRDNRYKYPYFYKYIILYIMSLLLREAKVTYFILCFLNTILLFNFQFKHIVQIND